MTSRREAGEGLWRAVRPVAGCRGGEDGDENDEKNAVRGAINRVGFTTPPGSDPFSCFLDMKSLATAPRAARLSWHHHAGPGALPDNFTLPCAQPPSAEAQTEKEAMKIENPDLYSSDEMRPFFTVAS